MPRLPTFFIVGAPKAATTSLYHYLGQHPEIYVSPIKEPHFFASEIRMENFDPAFRHHAERETRALREFLAGPMQGRRLGGIVSEWDDYLRLFARANGERALGEASTGYLWSPTAAERIAGTVPDARILVMLRDPADRAYSQYLHGLGNGAIRWSFREHIRRSLANRSTRFSIHYPFLEFGLYFEQLRRYLDRFGRNVWIGFQEDLLARPLAVILDACRFLGVSPEFTPDVAQRHLQARVPRTAVAGWLRRSGWWNAIARVTPPTLRPSIRRALTREPRAGMDRSDRRYLVDFYREDVGKTAGLLGCDLGAWLRD